MTKLLFGLLLFSSLFAHADRYWALKSLVHSSTAVKTISYFKKGSEAKMEGSGFLYTHDGNIYVVTSEHVVLPDNQKAVHIVRDENGVESEAEFVKANWELGLAILKIKNNGPWTKRNRDILHLQYLQSGVSVGATGLESFGFPADTTNLSVGNYGKVVSIMKPGAVLAGQRVYSIEGLQTEFGMSGGPVFAGEEFIGLMTHVTFEENAKTFVIPSEDIYKWLSGYGSSTFQRSYDDFQVYFFSSFGSEVIHHARSKTKIEKRKKDLLIHFSRSANSQYDFQGLPMLESLHNRMEDRQIQIAKIKGLQISGQEMLTDETSLSEFIALLTQGSGQISFDDFESKTVDPSLPATVGFKPRRGQTVTYDIQDISWPIKKKSQYYGGPIYWAPEKTIVKSRFSAWINQFMDGIDEQTQKQDPYDGYWRTSSDTTRTKNFTSTDWWRTKMKNCEGEGGTLEVISVKAGKFHTCAVTSGSRTTWYGNVPIYGIVKIEYSDGSTKELVSLAY